MIERATSAFKDKKAEEEESWEDKVIESIDHYIQKRIDNIDLSQNHIFNAMSVKKINMKEED